MTDLEEIALKHSPWVCKVAVHAGTVLLNLLEEGETGAISYKTTAESTEGESKGELTVLPCRLHRSLGILQELCCNRGLPCLPSLVVGKKTGIPGEGFYEAYAELYQQGQVDCSAILKDDGQMRKIAAAEQEACRARKSEDWNELRKALDALIS